MQSVEQLATRNAEVERNLRRTSEAAYRLAQQAESAYHEGLMGDVELADPWPLADGRLATADDVLAWQSADFATAAELTGRALFGTGFSDAFAEMLAQREATRQHREAFFEGYTTLRPRLSDPLGMTSGSCISWLCWHLLRLLRDDRVTRYLPDAQAARDLLGEARQWLDEHADEDGRIVFPR